MGFDDDYELLRTRFKKLYKKAKELDLHDDDLQTLKLVQKHQDTDVNILTLTVKYMLYFVVSVVLVSGVLYGGVKLDLISGRTVAQLTTLFTGVDLDTDDCVISYNTDLLELARPPANCSFCKNVSSFKRVFNISQTEFIDKYAYSAQPVIITDATTNWNALKSFSFDFLKGIYRNDSVVFDKDAKGCQFFPYQTEFKSLKEVFQMSQQRSEMNGAPWYIGWSNCDAQAANKLRQHYTRPYFLSPEMESSRTDWMFMGTPGFGANIHIDNVGHSSWQAQIKGDKRWILEPPPECYYECPGRFEDVVRSGEVIVLNTNIWYHGTNVVGDNLSIVIGSEYD